MNQKTIIILSIVAAVLIIAGGILWFFSGKAPDGEEGGFSGLFPTGGEQGIGGGFGDNSILPSDIDAERDLIQLTKDAAAGAAFAWETPSVEEEQSDGKTLGVKEGKVRYVEKSTGHIYEIKTNGKNRKRVSNTTILKVFKTFWSPKADKVVLRYLEDDGIFPKAKTFSAAIDPVSNSITGVFLPQSITEVAVSPAEDKVFYLNKAGGLAVGITADFENKKQNTIFTLPFGEFNIDWPSKNIITLVTKPARAINGMLYFLNPATEKLEKIIGNVKGLAALVSPDAKKIIYSQSAGKGLNTRIFDVDEKSSSVFNLKTLAEKCVWSEIGPDIIYCGVPSSLPRAQYPDDWHKGKISFNDSIWKIDILSGETILLMEEAGVDIIEPFLTPDEKYLIFTDKKDSTLWSLKLD